MANVLKHKTPTAQSDNPAFDVSANEWNEEHLYAGALADGDALVWSAAASDKVKWRALGVLASITAQVSVSNSTSDTSILAHTVKAGSLVAGDVIKVRAFGTADCQEAASTTLDLWIKDNGGTKVATLSIATPTNAQQATKYWGLELFLTFRAVGASGTYVVAAVLDSDMPTAGATANLVSADTNSIDTTADRTFTLGMNWNVANASNIGRAEQAFFLRNC